VCVILKTVLDNGLLNILMVYAPDWKKPEEQKESFCNKVLQLVSYIPQNEMVVLAGDMKGMLEVVMLAMMGHRVVLGMEKGMQMEPGS